MAGDDDEDVNVVLGKGCEEGTEGVEGKEEAARSGGGVRRL